MSTFEEFTARHQMSPLWEREGPERAEVKRVHGYLWREAACIALFLELKDGGWDIFLPATEAKTIHETDTALAQWLAANKPGRRSPPETSTPS